MNVKRFAARTSREALALVREALGEDAVVLSTKPCADGVEVMAMAPEGLQQAHAAGAQASVVRAPQPVPERRGLSLAERIAARGEHRPDRQPPVRREPSLGSEAGAEPAPRRATERVRHEGLPVAAAAADALDGPVASDVETLGMSTLTFQDYVRERMLRRRQAEMDQQPRAVPDALAPPRARPASTLAHQASLAAAEARTGAARAEPPTLRMNDALRRPAPVLSGSRELPPQRQALPRRDTPVLHDSVRLAEAPELADDDAFDTPPPPRGRGRPAPVARDSGVEVMGELREVRQLIEERFGMLAFMERMQRDPRQVALLQKLFDAGLSPGLVRKMAQALPADAADELAWATGVLERNLLTSEPDDLLEDHQGVLAFIGATGVGKTTTTAKIAAAFATRHGAANLGLITLDAYRVAAHEQLRTYGRILGVPVHTAHDRASLEDLLELLSSKQLVLIDTAGVAQRDSRTRELLEMLQHRAIEKVLVLNAASQGETVEDVMSGYGVSSCRGVILSKLDEAVKLGPALDALIRHRARVLGVANGQRVPEDWHHLSTQALVQRALRGGGTSTWRLDANEVNLVFAGTHGGVLAAGQAGHAGLPA